MKAKQVSSFRPGHQSRYQSKTQDFKQEMVEKPDSFQINSVHIGNFGSAFVEVLVGRKGLVAGKDGFVGLLPSSSFQDPLEARSEKNSNRVKLFTGVVNNTVPTYFKYLFAQGLSAFGQCLRETSENSHRKETEPEHSQ